MKAKKPCPMTKWRPEIEDAALKSSALCIALFGIKKPELRFSNNAFQLLSGNDPFQSLKNPTFGRLRTMAEGRDVKSLPVFEGMLTIGDESDSNTTINARVFVNDEEMLVTGEIDLARINKQNRHMVKLNRETSNLQRRLTKEKMLLENTLEELKTANEELAILNREKNRFLNIAANDLRNPISTAISLTNILISERDSFSVEEQQEFLENVAERLDYSLRLMTELLDVSKIESGSLDLNLEYTDYMQLVNKSLNFNQLMAGCKDIGIQTTSSENELYFHFDKSKMEQVLNNLISNALKYSHKGSEIMVRVEVQNDMVKTSVIDHGVGIKDEELPHIFQPFQKSGNRPTAGESSTGLGLAISKKIIEEHNGIIDVESRKDHGSVFSFLIPMDSQIAEK